MVTFKIISNQAVIVTITKELREKDLNGISIIVEALLENDYNKSLNFFVDKNLDVQCHLLLENFYKHLPYNYQIKKLKASL